MDDYEAQVVEKNDHQSRGKWVTKDRRIPLKNKTLGAVFSHQFWSEGKTIRCR